MMGEKGKIGDHFKIRVCKCCMYRSHTDVCMERGEVGAISLGPEDLPPVEPLLTPLFSLQCPPGLFSVVLEN